MKGFKNVKRSLLCGVATVLVTGMAAVPTSVTPAQENYVSENQNKHVINNISYDKNKVRPGESFTLSLSLDNIDKIEYGHVSIGIVGSYGGVSERHKALFKKNNGRLEATFEVDNTWKNGKYDLEGLLIYDTDGSRTWRSEGEYGQIMGINFPEEIKRSVLVNGSKEQNPILPTIKDIKITPSTAKPGDVVEIEMNLSDKIIGDKEYLTVTFIKRAQSYGLDIGDTVILKPKNDTTLYGRTTISDKWKEGTYTARIDSDSVNASGSYNEDNLTITDENNAKDSEAPEIKSVSLDKDHAKPGEEVKISVKASDASGLKKGEIVFRDVENSFIISAPLEVVSSDTLQGVIKPYNNYENGEYHISSLVVTDKYDNEKNIYGIHYEDYKINWSDYNISVNNDSFTISDSIKTDGFPLKKISFDKGLYKIGDTVNITAEAKSGGIDIPYAYVNIWEVLYGPGGGIYAPIETVQLLPNGNNGLSGSFTISNVGKHYSPDRGELYEPNNYYTIKRAKAFDLGNYTFYEKSWSDENEMFLLGYNDVIETEMSVSLDKKNLVIDKGKSGKLTATVKPDNAKDKTVTWSSSNTNVATVDNNGNVTAVNHGTAKITAKTSNGKTAECEVRVNADTFTGVKMDAGQLKRFKSGAVDTAYTGVDKYTEDGKWYYFEKGIHNPTFTGIAKSSKGNWIFVKDGVYDAAFTGIAKSTKGNWLYAKNGRYDTSYTGVAKSTKGNWLYVTGGRWDTKFTGVAKATDGRWLYVKDGRHDSTFTGAAKSTKGNWIYVNKGVYTTGYSGVTKATDGKWLYMKNGRHEPGFTGVAKSDKGNWIYVKNGIYDTSFTGVAKSTKGNWIYVKNGRYDASFTGIAQSTKGNKLYIVKGRWQNTYTGKYQNYNIKNGYVI